MCDLVKSFDTIPHHILNALSNVGVLSTLQVVLQLPVQSTTTCGVGGPLILTSKPLFLSSTGFHPRLTALYCKWIPLTIFHGLQTLKLFRLYSTTLSNSGTLWFFNLMWTLFPMCMGVSVWSYRLNTAKTKFVLFSRQCISHLLFNTWQTINPPS